MRHLTVAVLGFLALSPCLAAQSSGPGAPRSTPVVPRWHFGAAADVGQPVGAFKRQVNNAAGVQAHLLLRLDARGRTALRLQGGWLNHGHERQPVCVGETPGCRIATHVVTTNNILSLGVGPEFSVSLGVFRLYAHGLVGVSRFSTLSALDGGLLPDFVVADENHGDAGLFYSGGGGIQLPINQRTALDLGIAFQGHGRREYLTEGGITDNPDGSLQLDLKRSAADVFAIRIGFSTALRWGMRRSAP